MTEVIGHAVLCQAHNRASFIIIEQAALPALYEYNFLSFFAKVQTNSAPAMQNFRAATADLYCFLGLVGAVTTVLWIVVGLTHIEGDRVGCVATFVCLQCECSSGKLLHICL